MAEKHRELPPWMTTSDERGKDKLRLTNLTLGKKKCTSTRKRVGRTVYYCLNERELVDAAVVYLTSDDGEPFYHHQIGEDSALKTTCVKAMDTVAEKRRRAPVLDTVKQSFDSGDQENIYVSETDIDQDDVATVQYTDMANTDRQCPEGHSKPVTSQQDSQIKEEPLQIPSSAASDDALRLVREIFFTRS